MSLQISEESMLILMSIYGGLVLVLCYDAIRILRRIFYVGFVRIIIEDVIFWTVAVIFMFNIYLKYNYGRPRFFSIILTVGTMFAFEWFIGRKIINVVAVKMNKILRKIVKPLKKVVKLIKLKIGKRKSIKRGRKNGIKESKKSNKAVKQRTETANSK